MMLENSFICNNFTSLPSIALHVHAVQYMLYSTFYGEQEVSIHSLFKLGHFLALRDKATKLLGTFQVRLKSVAGDPNPIVF